MSDLPSLLPPNASSFERDLEQVSSRLDDVALPISTLWSPDTCPEHLLPWLAWAFSVDVWEPRWPLEVRRNVLRDAIDVHRKKGTKGSILRALGTLGIEPEIEEWFEYGGAPFTFRVTAKPEFDLIGDATIPFLSQELRAQVLQVLEYVKPVRAHFDLTFLIEFTARLSLASHPTRRTASSARFSVSRIDRLRRGSVADSAAPRARHLTIATLEVQ